MHIHCPVLLILVFKVKDFQRLKQQMIKKLKWLISDKPVFLIYKQKWPIRWIVTLLIYTFLLISSKIHFHQNSFIKEIPSIIEWHELACRRKRLIRRVSFSLLNFIDFQKRPPAGLYEILLLYFRISFKYITGLCWNVCMTRFLTILMLNHTFYGDWRKIVREHQVYQDYQWV